MNHQVNDFPGFDPSSEEFAPLVTYLNQVLTPSY